MKAFEGKTREATPTTSDFSNEERRRRESFISKQE
jgi:hypothetical protein